MSSSYSIQFDTCFPTQVILLSLENDVKLLFIAFVCLAESFWGRPSCMAEDSVFEHDSICRSQETSVAWNRMCLISQWVFCIWYKIVNMSTWHKDVNVWFSISPQFFGFFFQNAHLSGHVNLRVICRYRTWGQNPVHSSPVDKVPVVHGILHPQSCPGEDALHCWSLPLAASHSRQQVLPCVPLKILTQKTKF